MNFPLINFKRYQLIPNYRTGHFWAHIANGYYDFGRSSFFIYFLCILSVCTDTGIKEIRDAEDIKNLTKDDILSFFDNYIADTAPHRSKLSIHMCSQRLNEDAVERLKTLLSQSQLSVSTDLETALKQNPTFEETKTILHKYFKSSLKLDNVFHQLDDIRWPAITEGAKEVTKEWRQQLRTGPIARPTEKLSKYSL